MTSQARNRITTGGIVGGSVILAALLALVGFETKHAHSADIQTEQTARNQQYRRLLCEVQAVRKNDKNTVCE